MRKTLKEDPSNLECFIGSAWMWLAIIAAITWAGGSLTLSQAVVTLFVSIIGYCATEPAFRICRKIAGLFQFNRFLEELVLPLLESSIAVAAGWMILAFFTIVLPALATFVIWLTLSALMIIKKLFRRYNST